jgi:hypothetical protein
MPTDCQLGEVRSLGVALDAPWDEVLARILYVSNLRRSPEGQVTLDTFEAARGIVPPMLLVEYLREVNGDDPRTSGFSVCYRYGTGDNQRTGIARIPFWFAEAFGGGADPTDPWSASLMVLSDLRKIAEVRLVQYGRMWEDALRQPGSACGASEIAEWYRREGVRHYEVTQDARDLDFRSVYQFKPWGFSFSPANSIQPFGIHDGGMPPASDWPLVLARDIDFWGVVLLEKFVGGAVADKLWRGIVNEGNGGLCGYYRPGGNSTPALASMLADGIVWVYPLTDYARYLVRNYANLPNGQRRAMNLTGSEINLLDSNLVRVSEALHRIPEAQEYKPVGPYHVGEHDHLSWAQQGDVSRFIVNPQAVSIPSLYATLLPCDDSVRRWAGMREVRGTPPPAPPDTEPPIGPPGPPVSSVRVEAVRRSPFLPFLLGLGVPLAGFGLWLAWRKT